MSVCTKKVKTRFAPSPTGFLHLGHAYSALRAHDFALQAGGSFILRIEDIDPGRCKAEYETAILEDLSWLGLSWPSPVRRQSEHMDDYAKALNSLSEQGLTYPCFCSRKEIAEEILRASGAPHGPDGPPYPGVCRRIPHSEGKEKIGSGAPHAIRLNMAKAIDSTDPLTWHDTVGNKIKARPELFGDVVIARKETPTSYHLAVTVDDHLQGITTVVRGEDLFHSTHIHRLLQALLGFDVPQYLHHHLLTDESGRRYAKRDRAKTVRSLRKAGVTPGEIRQKVGLLYPDR